MSDSPAARPPISKWMLLGCAAIVVLSAIGWSRLHIDSSLEPILPEHSEARRTVLFLRDSSFAAKAVLWFRLTDQKLTTADLIAAADATQKKLDPKLISRVIQPTPQADAMAQGVALLDHAGELLGPTDLAEIEQATQPADLSKRMREIYLQLLKPEGSFLQPILRRDPLGIETRILTRLLALTKGLNYNVQIQSGHLLSPDGRQLILPMESSTTATSLAGSESLVHHLEELAKEAPSGVEIIPICAQTHTVQNSQLMRSDINRAGVVNTIAFLGLFLLVCRDIRVGAVFLLPIVTIIATIGLCALIVPNLSTIVIGLAVTMAGSAVDYGIFVYTAVWLGKDSQANIRKIIRPLIICHLTTLGVFIALLFSHVPAYRQLGYLTSISLVLSLLGAIFVLPALIKPGGKLLNLGTGIPLEKWGRLIAPVAVVGLIGMFVAGVLARKIHLDADISKLDGVSDAVKQNEANFQRTWSTSDVDQALLVVTGKTFDDADEANDRIFPLASAKLPAGQFVSLASFWPSARTRSENLRHWQAFWTTNRITRLRQNLTIAAKSYDFAPDAFDPFFQSLNHPPTIDAPNPILDGIESLFVAQANVQPQILSFFPDTDANVTAMRQLVADYPDAEIVSRRALGQAFAESALSENRLLIGISCGLIVASLLLLTRSILKSAVIMLPAVAAVIFMLATLVSLSLSLSVVSVIVAVLLLALASDYGVFGVYAWDGGETMLGQAMASMHLSSLTTLAGTASLIFARHPALHLVGISMTAGVLGGYLTAFVILPGSCWLLTKTGIWRRA